jgi:hypothetical protein
VGYLGPSLSELICEFGQYIEQNDALNGRYLGGSITAKSSGFRIDSAEVQQISSEIQNTLNSDHFSAWLCEYFALGIPPILEDEMEMAYMPSYLRSLADEGAQLCKPCGQKMTFIPSAASKSYHVQMGTVQFNLSFDDLPLLHLMASENNFPLRNFANHMDLLQELLSEKIIFIAE